MEVEKIAQEALGFNKAVEVHVTSDGVAFLEKAAAKYHAGTLANKVIRTFSPLGEIKVETETVELAKTVVLVDPLTENPEAEASAVITLDQINPIEPTPEVAPKVAKRSKKGGG